MMLGFKNFISKRTTKRPKAGIGEIILTMKLKTASLILQLRPIELRNTTVLTMPLSPDKQTLI